MPEAMTGHEYLEMLRRQNGRQTQSFRDFSEFLEAKARKQGVPIHGQFELSPLCNLSCGMCYVRLSPEQLGDRCLLTVDQWKGLIHQAFEAGMFQATLTGGECLAYPGFEELYLYLHSLGCEVDVLTNGTLLDEGRIRFFQNHLPALIQITLYGQNEDVYERVTGRRVFHTVLDHLRQVKEAGLPLLITITPNRALGEDVFETIRLARELTEKVFINTSLFAPPEEPWRLKVSEDPDADYYARILRFDEELQGKTLQEYPEQELPLPGGPCRRCEDTGFACGSTAEAAKPVSEDIASGEKAAFGEEKGLICGGGRSGFVINWKGEMRICNRLDAKSFPLREGFEQAWKKIHQTAENWPRAAECRGCAYENVCSICAADAMKYAKPGKMPVGLCERTRYMVSRGVLPFARCDPAEGALSMQR
ncbi:MAG: radical SAM protein [Blautia sp.]|nr:radical SAM protein [Blautia sp.]